MAVSFRGEVRVRDAEGRLWRRVGEIRAIAHPCGERETRRVFRKDDRRDNATVRGTYFKFKTIRVERSGTQFREVETSEESSFLCSSTPRLQRHARNERKFEIRSTRISMNIGSVRSFYCHLRAYGRILSAGMLACLFPMVCFAASQAVVQKQVVFDQYSPLAGNAELIDRLFRPLLARRMRERLAASGQGADAQGIDLAREHFALYVPANAPSSGKFGLLVWISPFDAAAIPAAWLPVLDKHETIVVTAAGSGNAANVYSRRIPLAMLGYANVAKAYPVDPARTYVGGLSGGSRVALRVALAFPDVFHGALLNAGSDSFGSAVLPPPKPELFRQFEEGTRLVYATGSRDEENLAIDAHSRESARDLCITDLHSEEMRGRGHDWIDAATLDRALTDLSAPRKVDAGLAACRERRTREIDAQLRDIEALVAAGNKREVEDRLQRLDECYGGLAAPRSVELEIKQ